MSPTQATTEKERVVILGFRPGSPGYEIGQTKKGIVFRDPGQNWEETAHAHGDGIVKKINDHPNGSNTILLTEAGKEHFGMKKAQDRRGVVVLKLGYKPKKGA